MVTSQNILKYVINTREHHSNRATLNEDRLLSDGLVAHVNQHMLDVHLGQMPELKLVYKCLCKRMTISKNATMNRSAQQQFNGTSSDADPSSQHQQQQQLFNEDELELDECVHDEWKMCRVHIVAASSQPIYSIRCPKCQLILVHKDFKSLINDYGEHIKTHQVNENESFFLCPICGIVTKYASTIHKLSFNLCSLAMETIVILFLGLKGTVI